MSGVADFANKAIQITAASTSKHKTEVTKHSCPVPDAASVDLKASIDRLETMECTKPRHPMQQGYRTDIQGTDSGSTCQLTTPRSETHLSPLFCNPEDSATKPAYIAT